MNRLALFAAVLILLSAALARAVDLEQDFAAAEQALSAVHPSAHAAEHPADLVLQLLDSSDQNVRSQAAKALREYAPSDRKVQNRLTAIMEDANDNVFVRKEAVKSLSAAASRSDELRRRLIAAARQAKNPDIVRSIACKSLYATLDSTNAPADVRDALTALLADPNERPAVRAGAAWGLFPDAARARRTQDALLAAADDESLDADARAEAIRSLYFALDQRWEILASVRTVAQDPRTPMPARFAAVMAFHRVIANDAVRDWLHGLARRASPVQIRTAAVLAQTEGLTDDLARYFHVTSLNGRGLDPLVNE